MRTVNKSWMAVVVAALLLGALVGVVWARPHDGPQAADITRKVTLSGGDFIPQDDADDWFNNGSHVRCQSGNCAFTAPVVFPCLPSVTVERIKLHVNDANNMALAQATLYRLYPPTAAVVELGQAESYGGTTIGVKTFTSPDINQVVWPSQKAYILLYISGTSIYVHGVTVEYHRNI